MAVSLVTVTGNLETLIGSTPSIGRVRFKLNRSDWTSSGDVFAPEYVEAVANSSTGAFSIALQSTVGLSYGSYYTASLLYRDVTDGKDKEAVLSSFYLPAGGPYELGDLLLVGPVSPLAPTIVATQISDASVSGLAVLTGTPAQGRDALNVEIGVDVQAYDADLAAIAALVGAADRLAYFTGPGAAALATFTAAARSFVAAVDAAAQRTALGLGTAATAAASSFATAAQGTKADSALQPAAIGVSVQSYDADLAAIAGLTTAADRFAYFTGPGAAALATLTSAARALLDDADMPAMRTTLGLGSAALADADDFLPQVIVEDLAFVHAITDEDGNVLLGIRPSGDVQVGEVDFQRTLPGESAFVHAFTDLDGNIAGGILSSGRARWMTETLDPTQLIAVGVLGTISDLAGWGAALYRMTITDGGVSLPYVTPKRAPLTNQAVVLDTSDVMEVHIVSGQSWATDELAQDFAADLDEPQLVAGLRDEDGAVMIIATNDHASGIFDLIGARPSAAAVAGGYVSIGKVSAIARQRFRRVNRAHLKPIIYVGGSAYPGYTTAQLMPGTEDPVTTPWTYGTQRLAQVAGIAANYGKTVNFRSISWTQGVEIDGAGIDYYDSLQTVLAAYTTYLGGAPVMFISQNPLLRTETLGRQNSLRQADWGAAIANGYCIGPRYPYPMRDDIHHTALGYAKLGELEGYVSHLVLDKGVNWEPLKALTVTASGSTVVITTNDPAESGALVRKTDLIEAATDDGFMIRVGGVLQTVASVVLAGTTITVTLGAAITPGASVSVRYAFERVLGSAPTGHSAGWGNICQQGPASVCFTGATVDFYLSMIDETITAT